MPDVQQFTADLHWAANRLRQEHGETSAADLIDAWAEGADIPNATAARPAGTCGRALSTGQPCPDHPAAATDVTVYELRTGTDDDPRPEVIARYATTLAAAAHGEHAYQLKHGLSDTLEWPSTGTDDAPRWRLEAVDDLDGDETETDWHIVAVTIPAAYVPAGGAR